MRPVGSAPESPDGQANRLSAIIPAYGNAETLLACIEALREADEPPGEIVVVDDGTPSPLELPHDVRLVRHATNRGPASARNSGAAAATGDWLLFVDSDVLVHRDVPARIRRAFTTRPEVALIFGVYSQDCLHKGVTSAYKNLYWRHKFLVLPTHTANVNSALMAVRRHVFEKAGKFNEETLIGEDRELGNAIVSRGFQTLLDKDLVGVHCKRIGLWRLLKEHFAAAVNATLVLMATSVRIRPGDGELLGATGEFLATIVAAPVTLVTLGVSMLTGSKMLLFAGLVWLTLFFGLNVAFLATCRRFRGMSFAAACSGLAFLEALVAFAGIVFAAVRYCVLGNRRRDFKVT